MKQSKCDKCHKPALYEVLVSVESRDQSIVYPIDKQDAIGMLKNYVEPKCELMYYCQEHVPAFRPVKIIDGMIHVAI